MVSRGMERMGCLAYDGLAEQLIVFDVVEAVRMRAVARAWRTQLEYAWGRVKQLDIDFAGYVLEGERDPHPPSVVFSFDRVDSSIRAALPRLCRLIDNAAARQLAERLPRALTSMAVNVSGTHVSLGGLRPVLNACVGSNLRELQLGWAICGGLGIGGPRGADESPRRGASSTPWRQPFRYSGDAILLLLRRRFARRVWPHLAVLVLDVDSARISLVVVRGFAASLPASLTHLELHWGKCGVADKGVLAVLRQLPAGLREFTLNVSWGGRRLTDAGMRAIAEHLPTAVTTLVLYVNKCAVTGAGVEALAQRLPGALTFLWLDVSATKVDERSLRMLADRLPGRVVCGPVGAQPERGLLELRWRCGGDVQIYI